MRERRAALEASKWRGKAKIDRCESLALARGISSSSSGIIINSSTSSSSRAVAVAAEAATTGPPLN